MTMMRVSIEVQSSALIMEDSGSSTSIRIALSRMKIFLKNPTTLDGWFHFCQLSS